MKRRVVLFLVSLAALLIADPLLAQEIPGLPIPVLDNVRAARSGQEASTSLALIMLVTVLSLAPALIMMMTSFTKVVIVFDFVRRALALQNMPPNQVLFGLALFLTFFIMAPTFREFNQTALTPYISGDKMSTPTFIEKGMDGAKEIALFTKLSGKNLKDIKSVDDIDSYILIPAFMLSEIKKAFIIGILIFIPFIVIDLVVASTLMSMGMIMLPPAMISMPFKIILFILVDGWHLITYNLVQSYVM